MKVAVFSTKPFDRSSLLEANKGKNHEFHFIKAPFSSETVSLARDFPALCLFVNDQASRHELKTLAEHGTGIIALRCAGYNNIDLQAAQELGITIARVPAYSPHAVAEHTLALILALNRKVHKAYNRVREGNFNINGLTGFDLHDKTVALIGTGKIGRVTAQILKGFGCRLLAYDPKPHPEAKQIGVEYGDLETILPQADIISLHCPLTQENTHLINDQIIASMKHNVMLINTSRGGLIETGAVIKGLKSGKIGYLGLDVYEEESKLFYQDLSGKIIEDDIFARLTTFPNVIITGHQAFLTQEALQNIADTTVLNLSEFEATGKVPHPVEC